MKTLAFSFTKLVVGNLDASERFYREALGLAPLRRTLLRDAEIPQEQSALSVPDDASAHILLLTRYLDRPPPAAGEAWTGFIVADLTACVEAVRTAGGAIVVPIHEAPAQRVRAAIVTDPEGHMIELIEMLADSTPA